MKMGCCFVATVNNIAAWVIIFLYALTVPPIIGKFIKIKENQEMRVREPKALIFMIVVLWVGVNLGAFHFLELDPDINDSEITDIYNSGKWGILNDLQIICIIAGFVTFFYRSWCLLVKSEFVRDATSYFLVSTAIVRVDDSRGSFRRTLTKTLITNQSGHRRNRRRAAVALSSIFMLCVSALVILSQIEISNEDRDSIRRLNLFVIVVLGSIFESWIIWNIKDRYGTLREFKFFALVGLFLVLVSIVCRSATDHYWGVIARCLCWGLTIWLLIIWLYFHIRRYSVDRLRKSQLGTKVTENFELHHVFREEEVFDNFRNYTKICLCAESFEFILDIYTIRRTIPEDPYLALSRHEAKVIQKCARITMPWIDRLITTNVDGVPTMDKIFELYIKPFSELEVNIPGKLQVKLVASFSAKVPTNMELLSSVDMELASVANRAGSVSPTEDTDPMTLSEGGLSEGLLSERSPGDIEDGATFKVDNAGTENELVVVKVKNEKKTSSQTPYVCKQKSSLKLPRTLKHLEINHRLNELYPVWKEMVMLLHNDTFVRYKQTQAKDVNSTWLPD